MTASSASAGQEVKRLWWLVALRGILLLVIGLLLLTNPAPTMVIYLQIWAVFILVDGFFRVIGAIIGREDNPWWWLLITGVIGILVGIAVLLNPLSVTEFVVKLIVMVVALIALFGGIFEMVGAIFRRQEIEKPWTAFLAGLVSMVLGILIMSFPLLSTLSLVMVVAVFAIIGGIASIIAGFGMRYEHPNITP